jgi:hypothetical protein
MRANRRVFKGLGPILGAGWMFMASAAFSQVLPAGPPTTSSFVPYGGLQYLYDSNVYRTQNSQAAFAISGDPTLADSSLRYLVGVDGTYLWSRQILTGNVQFAHQYYDHFTQLDHSEYQGNLHLDWKFLANFDGMAEFGETHAQAPFADRNAKGLTINTNRYIGEKFNVSIGPNWRLETGAQFRNLDAPIQNYPDFVERDVTETFALKYIGLGALTYGVQYTRLDGKFENAPDTGPYHQNSINATANYAVTALSTFTGALGYTKRDQAANLGSVSGYTGAFAYRRQLTPKTGIFIELTRNVNSYVAAGGSELDTAAAAGVNWQATYKLAFTANVQYMHSTFFGQAIPGSEATGRVDKLPGAGLVATYQIARRVLVRGHATYAKRESNVPDVTFSDSLIGVDLIGRWQ